MKKYFGVLCAVFLTVACLVVPASAVDYPPVPTDDTHLDYVVYKANDVAVFAYVFDSAFFDVVFDGARSFNLIRNDTTSTCIRYFLDDGSWDSGCELSQGVCVAFSSIIASTVDIYDSNGDLFFRAPPAPQPGLGETVEALTAVQGEAVRNQAVGVMKILVPCGVGCLALLIALPVLKKVFYRFLPL